MKKNAFTVLLLAVCCFSYVSASAQHLKNPVDKGVIKGDFTIQFADEELNNITLKPNEPFSLSQLGIGWSDMPSFDSSFAKYKKRQVKQKVPGLNAGYCYYKVQIRRPDDSTTYYGLLCFYGVTKKAAETEEVAQSYEITIPDAFFDQCRGGKIADRNEYWMKGDLYYCTWDIMFSDSRDLMWK